MSSPRHTQPAIQMEIHSVSYLWIFNRIGQNSYHPKMKLTAMSDLSSKNESAVKSTVSEYVQKSTIHGVAYVGDNERNKFERIWWFIMLVCSVFGASYLIYQAYRTMKEDPIIESPSLKRTPMWDVPFPAVTFCPSTDYRTTAFGVNKILWPDFADLLFPHNDTELPDNFGVYLNPLILEALTLRKSNQNIYDILTQVLPEIKIIGASFGIFNDIEVSLQKTITEYGACVTFNMYQEKDILRDGVIESSLDDATEKTEPVWSRDSGFNNSLPLGNYTFPLRSFTPSDSLVMALKLNNSRSRRISRFNADILVSFHAPDEVPVFGRHSEIVSIVPGKFNFIEITPHLVVSEDIEHYAPEVRQCYFSNERHLKFYKNYTQNHCEWECFANFTLDKCGCVPYHLPHFNDTKLCTDEFELQIFKLVLDMIFKPDFKDDAGHASIDDCDCLPSCTQLSYETVQTLTVDDEDIGNHTVVHIRNKYPYIKKHVRTELHSISEFFSDCGGSLGLFLGVSIFSILELLYFCTVRLYLHCKRRPVDANE